MNYKFKNRRNCLNYKYQTKYSSDVIIADPILVTGQKYNGGWW